MMIFFVVSMYIDLGSLILARKDLDSIMSLLVYACITMLGMVLVKNSGKIAGAVISGNRSAEFFAEVFIAVLVGLCAEYDQLDLALQQFFRIFDVRNQCEIDLTVLLQHIDHFKELFIAFLIHKGVEIGSLHQFILFHWCILILHSHTPFRRTASGLEIYGQTVYYIVTDFAENVKYQFA